MGTHEEDNTLNPEETELGFSSSSDFYSQTDETLVEIFKNVVLESNDDDTGGGWSNYDLKDDVVPESSKVLPLRPYVGDCPHYIRTGMCKFGVDCKFNHTVKRPTLVVEDKDWSSDKAANAKIQCKYFLTPGGCKFGDACRYSHSKNESEIETPGLNFLGLPKRLGEKECPYYMRNGYCGYAAQCVFHHPEPFSVEGLDLQKFSLDDKSLRQSGYSLGSPTSESASLHLLEAYQRDQAPWFSHPSSSSTFSCLNDCSFYMTANSVPQGMHWHSKFPGYQAEEFPQQRRGHTHLNPEANRADILQQDIPMQVEEFPERPGQPECANFVKTGYCKFKSACRFHHPKGQPTCILSDKGLPLRPGGQICPPYERVGLCIFGRACPFDHPVNNNFSML